MTKRPASISDEFSSILASRTEPYRFVEMVARLLGSKGEEVRRWAECLPSDELQQRILNITEGGCRDEWEFLFRISKSGSPDAGESLTGGTADSNRADHSTGRSGRAGAGSEAGSCTDAGIVGEKVRALITDLVDAVSSFVVTESRAMFVIEGRARSGKTLILNEIHRAVLARTQVPGLWYRDLSGRSMFGKPGVILLDDADLELTCHSSTELDITKYYRSSGANHVFILTCRDTAKLTTIIEACDAKVVTIPELSAGELAELIGGMIIRGYALRRPLARRLASLLYAIGVENKISVAYDVVNALLYPKIISDYTSGAVPLAPPNHVAIAPGEMERAVSRVTNIMVRPPDSATAEFLRRELKRKIRGQDAVLDKILPSLASIASGMIDPTKPAGVLFFYGPTGVGKTELAKVIAEVLFDGNFHKEEMNTFSEKHSVSRLTGAPPGYVGYSDTPAIMDFIDKKRRGVLLLDEIEKAHETVTDHIMELLDTGIIKDAKGKVHDARGCLIVMTSNITFGDVYRYIGFTYPDMEPKLEKTPEAEELRKSGAMKAEFVGRLQVICKFAPLETCHIESIAKLMLENLERRLLAAGMAVSTEQYIADVMRAYQQEQGARSMRTYVETVVKVQIQNAAREKGGQDGKECHDEEDVPGGLALGKQIQEGGE